MTIDEAIKQIKSSDPTIRRQAVIEIGKSKNPSMLSLLADVYKTDSDPDVRAIALKAGQYIKANMGPKAPSDPVPLYAPPAEAPAAAPPPTQARVSDMNRQRASGYLSQALDYQMRGEILKASENLGRAFDLNPGLADDPLAKNLAADLTGQGPTPAVRTFLDRNARAQFMASKGGRKVPGGGAIALATSESSETGWGGALLDMLILGLAVGALSFIATIVVVPPMINFFNQMATQTTMSSTQQQMLQQQVQTMQSMSSPGFALPQAIIAGLEAAIGLLIQCGIIHLIAKTALGGNGLLTSLIHKLAFFQIILIPIVAGLVVVMLLILLPQLGQNTQNIQSIFPIIWLVGMGVGLFALYYTARLIGQNYSFGTGKGCLAMFLYVIVVIVFAVCLSVTLGGVLGGLLNRSGTTGAF